MPHVRKYLEYERGATRGARAVKQIDKLEMLLQAREYERARRVGLEEFFEGTRGKFDEDACVAWVAYLRAARAADGDAAAATPASHPDP